MKISDLKQFERDTILVITGEFASHYDGYTLSYHPEAQDFGDNRPKTVIKNIEEMCKMHCNGIVITHSPFVFDAFELYSKKYNHKVRFFIWGDRPYDEDVHTKIKPSDIELTECTDKTSMLYDIACRGIEILKTERYYQENSLTESEE